MPATAIEPATWEMISSILRRYHVPRAGIFGSVARGTTHPGSDLDILFQPPPGMGYFQLAHMGAELEAMLGCPVDLVTFASLHPAMRVTVYADYVELYDDRPLPEQDSITSIAHAEEQA